MDTGVANTSRADALGALAWLVDAGVDTIVTDEPGCWLRAPEAPVAADAAPPPAEETAPVRAPPSATSLEPLVEGRSGASVVLVMDADPRAGADRILADAEQRLLQRMLAAIGIDVDAVTRIGLRGAAPALPEGARAALLLGDGPARAVLGKPVSGSRGEAHGIGDIAVVATFAPAFLISQPRAKAHAWADLRLFAATMPDDAR